MGGRGDRAEHRLRRRDRYGGAAHGSRHWLLFGAGVLVFGLVHGLGLSTRLQDLGLPEDGLLARVIAFNVGIEIGQLAALTVVVLLGRLVIKALEAPLASRRASVRRYSSLGLAAVGAVAAVVLADRAVEGVDPYDEMLTATSGSCEVDEQEAAPVSAGRPPYKEFFAPTETLPIADFAYVLNEGLVTIWYNARMPTGESEQIQKFVNNTQGAVAGPMQDESQALVAVTRSRVLTCEAVDIEALAEFLEMWSVEWDDRLQEKPEASASRMGWRRSVIIPGKAGVG